MYRQLPAKKQQATKTLSSQTIRIQSKNETDLKNNPNSSSAAAVIQKLCDLQISTDLKRNQETKPEKQNTRQLREMRQSRTKLRLQRRTDIARSSQQRTQPRRRRALPEHNETTTDSESAPTHTGLETQNKGVWHLHHLPLATPNLPTQGGERDAQQPARTDLDHHKPSRPKRTADEHRRT
jgi:hypothetical protein